MGRYAALTWTFFRFCPGCFKFEVRKDSGKMDNLFDSYYSLATLATAILLAKFRANNNYYIQTCDAAIV